MAESFDQSLTYLLVHESEEFIRFGLGDTSATVVHTLYSSLPSHRRDVDAAYLVEYQGTRMVVHLAFSWCYQSQEALAADVTEVQLELYRATRLPVLSQVWDWHGKRGEPVLEERTVLMGAPQESPCTQCVYRRVNLRGLGWEELLTRGPPALWPLLPLAGSGASEEVMCRARDAIEGRVERNERDRADCLAVLMFAADAAGVPLQAVLDCVSKERLMTSRLYQAILDRGELRGETQSRKETIIRVLTSRLELLNSSVSALIWKLEDLKTLERWYEQCFQVVDAEGARELVEKIKRDSACLEDPSKMSPLYREILAKGEARVKKRVITQILTRRLGSLEEGVAERIQALNDTETLKRWHEEALLITDDESARRLAESIKQWS